MLPSCAAVQQLLAAEDKSFLLHVCAQGAPSLPVCMYTLSVSKKYPTLHVFPLYEHIIFFVVGPSFIASMVIFSVLPPFFMSV